MRHIFYSELPETADYERFAVPVADKVEIHERKHISPGKYVMIAYAYVCMLIEIKTLL
jgi:hypothetical protein